jgi:hypothetical protein
MKFRIAFYDNPQIDNGLSLSFRAVQSEACVVGLLMRNYRPRLMEGEDPVDLDAGGSCRGAC